MKDKILYLILGILIGAVITAGSFLAFSKHMMHGMRFNRPDMSNMNEDFRKEKPENMKETSTGNNIEAENTVTE